MDSENVDGVPNLITDPPLPIDTDDQSIVSSIGDANSPPAFGEEYGHLTIANDALDTKADLADDGRINIKFRERSRRLSMLAPLITEKQLDLPSETEALLDKENYDNPPPLNIVVQIIGSRGDIQPFIALGKALKKYGHNVRIATHPTFREFVKENDLDFFSVGGDPAELMSYMVRNPGLIPGLESIRAGDVGARRKNMYEMMVGFWLSCISPSDDSSTPFLADAIIANPPSYAGIHCAEKLGIPLHLMFTMPWSPTHEFPHPLANIKSTNMEPNTTNLMTYPMVDLLTWQGLGDVVNKFRKHTLRLEELSPIWAPSLIQRAKIPYTYCWSPALIPKPKDWGAHIDISGFFFLKLANQYTPPDDLAAFLAAGPPPVYIGFGSIVVKDPAALTKLIFDAVAKLGIRALVSEGWGGLGAGTVPENIFMLGNCPHDWLFKQVSAVVHHGGAGTTAIGLRLGRPTVIVPFFGDQAFWARMVYAAGAGPEPQPFKTLTADRLAEAIKVALAPEATKAAAKLAERMTNEHGAPTAAQSFHRMLPLKKMRCAVLPNKLAVWRVRRTNIIISSFVAIVLIEHKLIKAKDVKPCSYWQPEVNDGPYEPISGVAGSLIASMGSVAVGFGTILAAPSKAICSYVTQRKQTTNIEALSLATENYQTSPLASPLATPLDSPASSPRVSREFKYIDSETSSITSLDSPEKVHKPNKLRKNVRRTIFGGTEMRRTLSDQSNMSTQSTQPHREDSAQYKQFKKDVGPQGLGRVVKGIIDAPVDFSMALAQGFHNLPLLYGQKVRSVEHVKSFSSGLKIGGREFGLGFYDGLTHFFMDPIIGAKEDGGVGFVKGIGSGTLDLIVRSAAGFWALPAYALKGAQVAGRTHKFRDEFRGIFGKRLLRGLEDFQKSTHEERQEIIRLWKDNGFEEQLKKRGEIRDQGFLCPLQGCHVHKPHIHEVSEVGNWCILDSYRLV